MSLIICYCRNCSNIDEDGLKASEAKDDPSIVEKTQCQERVYSQEITKNYVDNQMCVKNNEDYLDEMDKIEIRTKALEVAVSLFKTSLAPTTDTANVVAVAQRFYNYITKGE